MWNFIENHPNVITDAILPAVVAVMGLVWGMVKRCKWLAESRCAKAVACLEAGVQLVYDDYVRAIKLASADGKLTEEERRIARNKAIDAAKAYAASYGIDLVKELGAEILPVMIEKIIVALKGKTAATVPAITPDNMPELGS